VANSKLIQGDVAEAVARVKGEFGRVDVIAAGTSCRRCCVMIWSTG
jgi:hypothetical protein